jgi:hypothetical protein
VVTRELPQAPWHLVRRDADGPIEAELHLVLPTYVDQERAVGDQLASIVRLDPQG